MRQIEFYIPKCASGIVSYLKIRDYGLSTKMDGSVLTDLEITLLSKRLRRIQILVEEINENHSSQISIKSIS